MAPVALNAANLGQTGLTAPRYDRAQIRPGIVHLGLGGFHRAHMARYTHDLLEADASGVDWGIVGVGLRPADQKLIDALRAQDHLFTLTERAGADEQLTIIGSIIGSILLQDSPAPVLTAVDSARIVSLTVTEHGYCLSPATKRVDLAHPQIAADLTNPRAPRTAIGIIAEGLRRRYEHNTRAFTSMSCDNIQHNGDVLRQAVTDFAGAVDPALADWIADNARFPNTMVDRITPATQTDDIAALTEAHNIIDACPVFSETFRQWVIEDEFVDGRPAWERVGAQFVADVTPYEYMKLRLLNASHLAIAGVGRLAGYTYVDETMRDSRFAAFMQALMDRETGPTLRPVPGIDLAAYKQTLISRFANPRIKDTLDRINTDAALNYILDPLRDRLQANESFDLLALALAAWIKRLDGVDDTSRPITFNHPRADELKRAAASDVTAVLAISPVFGDLSSHAALVETTRQWRQSLRDVGAIATLERALAR